MALYGLAWLSDDDVSQVLGWCHCERSDLADFFTGTLKTVRSGIRVCTFLAGFSMLRMLRAYFLHLQYPLGQPNKVPLWFGFNFLSGGGLRWPSAIFLAHPKEACAKSHGVKFQVFEHAKAALENGGIEWEWYFASCPAKPEERCDGVMEPTNHFQQQAVLWRYDETCLILCLQKS